MEVGAVVEEFPADHAPNARTHQRKKHEQDYSTPQFCTQDWRDMLGEHIHDITKSFIKASDTVVLCRVVNWASGVTNWVNLASRRISPGGSIGLPSFKMHLHSSDSCSLHDALPPALVVEKLHALSSAQQWRSRPISSNNTGKLRRSALPL
jgi:hypothetical protein